MNKVWIIAAKVRNGAEISPESTAEIFDSLRERIDGDFALAIIPRTAADIALIEKAANGGIIVQVVLPQEIPASAQSVPESLRSSWEATVSRPDLGVNILPGRGTTPSDWEDAENWLDDLAEIRMLWANAPKQPIDPKPTVFRETDSGEWCFANFPDSGRLRNEDFERVLEKALGKKKIPVCLADCKSRASEIANRWAPAYRILETGTLILNLGPPLVLAFGALLIWEGTTISIWEFGLAFTALILALIVNWLAVQKRWVHSRATAEVCRSLIASTPFLGPLFPVAARFLPDYAPLARSLALSSTDRTERLTAGNAIELRDRYLTERLDPQIAYYKPRSLRAGQFRRQVQRVFGISISVSLLATSLALAYDLGLSELVKKQKMPEWYSDEFHRRYIAGFATFAFPAIAAACLGILGLHESTRRAELYGEICRRLKKRRAFLAKLRSPSSIREAVRDIEEILTDEVAGWLRRRIF